MACFILAIEPFANIIRQDAQLHPIRIPNQPSKSLAQYADDTTICSCDINDFERIQRLAESFEQGAGARLNRSKTEVILFGDWTDEDRAKIPEDNLKENIKVLGVWLGPDASRLNSERITKKVDEVIEKWQEIPLSFEGKKLIIETKILSQAYNIVRITGMNTQLLNELQKRITAFLWHPRKMCLVSLSTLQNSYSDGGIELPNLNTVNKAILVERVAKLAKGDRPWKGHFIYRLGYSLRDIDHDYASNRYAHTFRQTRISSVIASTFRELKEEIDDWSDENFKSLKKRLHKNSDYRKRRNRNYDDTWTSVHSSTQNRKRRDLMYLIAHDSLTVGATLTHRGMNIDDSCRFCGLLPETTDHLFIDCIMIQDLKAKLEQKIGLQIRTLGEEEILFHEGRIKMKKKENNYVAAYKHSIWITRAKLYYGNIDLNDVKRTMSAIFENDS